MYTLKSTRSYERDQVELGNATQGGKLKSTRSYERDHSSIEGLGTA